MKKLHLRSIYIKILIFVLCIFLLLTVIASFVLQKFVNSESVHERIIEKIVEKTQSDIKFDKLEFSLLPSPHLSVLNGTFQSEKNFKADFNFDSVEIYPKIISLLNRKIEIKDITLNKPNFIFELPEKKNETPENKTKKKSFLRNFEFYYNEFISHISKLPINNLEVNDGKVTILKQQKEYLHIRKVGAEYQSNSSKIEFNFSANSDFAELFKLSSEISPSDMKTEAKLYVKRLNPEYLSGVLLKDSVYKIEKSELDLELLLKIDSPSKISGDIKSREFSLNLFNKDSPFIISGKNLNGTFLIDQDSKKLFRVKEVDFINPRIEVAAELLIDDQNKKNSLKITGSDVDIESVRETALSSLNQHKVTGKIFQILKSGHGESLEIYSESDSTNELFNDFNFKIKGKIKDGEIYDPDLDLTFNNIKGETLIKNGTLFVSNVSGQTGKTKFKNLTGNYDLENKVKLEVASIDSNISINELYDHFSSFKKIQHYLKNYKEAKITINIQNLSLKKENADSKKWELKFKSSGTIYDEEKLNYSLNFLKTPEKLKIDNLFLKDSNTDAKLNLEFNEENYKVDFKGRLAEKTTNRHLKNDWFSFGWVEGNINLNFMRQKSSKITANGNLTGNKLVIPYKGSPVIIDDFSLKADGSRINIEKLGLSLNKSEIALSGNLSSSADSIALDLEASSDEIDWEDISVYFDDKENTDSENIKAEPGKQQFKGNVKFNFLKFKKEEFVISPAVGNVEFSSKSVNLKIQNASVCDINSTGDFIFNNNNLAMEMDAYSENRKLENTLHCFFDYKDQVTGDYVLNISLNADGNMDKIREKLNGNYEFIIKDGIISGSNPLLLSILKVTNITEIYRGKIPDLTSEGLQFTKIDMNGQVKDGVIKIKDASLESPYVGFRFDGKINLEDDTYEVTFWVTILKTIHDVVEKVPLVKKIKPEKLFSIPVKVKGSLGRPDLIESYKE